MSDSHILNSPEYLNWIKSFRTNCVHVYLDEETPSLELENVYCLQAQLNSVNQKLFPLLHGQTKQFRKMKEKVVIYFIFIFCLLFNFFLII